MKHRVYIVEDHAVVREGYADMIEREQHFTVCGMASTAEAALEEIPVSQPDLVLVDISLPGMSGIDLIDRLPPDYPTLVVTGHDGDQYRKGAFLVGARGYVSKYEGPIAVLEAMHAVLENQAGDAGD